MRTSKRKLVEAWIEIHQDELMADWELTISGEEIMKKITAEEFDTKFDNDDDIDEYLDFSTAIRLKDIKELNTQTKKVNVDFPEWVIESLDKEATLL